MPISPLGIAALSLIGRRDEMLVCARGGECVGEVSNLFIKGAKENQRNARATFLPPYKCIDCFRTLKSVGEKGPNLSCETVTRRLKKATSRTIDLKSQRNSSTRAQLRFRLFLVN
jgi:hypothetical protein